MKLNSTQVIVRPLVTEKGTLAIEDRNSYPFEVAINANKPEIRRAVEQVFNVRVKSVRTIRMKGKLRGPRLRRSRTSDWKKAVVTLMAGEKIEFI